MRMSPILALPLLALAACHARVDMSDADENASGGNVHIAMGDAAGGASGVSVKAPGFSANVSLPNINLSGHLDLDGIKLAPDTKVGSFDINAEDKGARDKDDSGTVRVGYTSPHDPASVIDHYARSAADAGYGDIVKRSSSLSARKAEKTFTVNVAPEGTGSRGTITIAGKG